MKLGIKAYLWATAETEPGNLYPTNAKIEGELVDRTTIVLDTPTQNGFLVREGMKDASWWLRIKPLDAKRTMGDRGGSVCLNRLLGVAEWISALVMLLPGLASAR